MAETIFYPERQSLPKIIVNTHSCLEDSSKMLISDLLDPSATAVITDPRTSEAKIRTPISPG